MQGDEPMEYADAQAEIQAEGEAIDTEAEEQSKIDTENQAYADEAIESDKIESMKVIRKESKIVISNMVQHGGAFIVALSQLIVYANDKNLRKIKDAFHKYWIKYLEMEPISGKKVY